MSCFFLPILVANISHWVPSSVWGLTAYERPPNSALQSQAVPTLRALSLIAKEPALSAGQREAAVLPRILAGLSTKSPAPAGQPPDPTAASFLADQRGQ